MLTSAQAKLARDLITLVAVQSEPGTGMVEVVPSWTTVEDVNGLLGALERGPHSSASDERRRRMLGRLSTVLPDVVALLRCEAIEANIDDREGRAKRAAAMVEELDAMTQETSALALPDHCVKWGDDPLERTPDGHDSERRTLVDCLTAALAPGEIVTPMDLVKRAQAFRRHSTILASVREVLRGEPAGVREPLDHECVDAVADGVLEDVETIADAIGMLADAIGMLADAAKRAAEQLRRTT